jgi:hypothetical protein
MNTHPHSQILEIPHLLENAFEKFIPESEAYATCRVLEGQWEKANLTEYAQKGTIDGAKVTVFWLFFIHELFEDASLISFDAQHVAKIVYA